MRGGFHHLPVHHGSSSHNSQQQSAEAEQSRGARMLSTSQQQVTLLGTGCLVPRCIICYLPSKSGVGMGTRLLQSTTIQPNIYGSKKKHLCNLVKIERVRKALVYHQ